MLSWAVYVSSIFFHFFSFFYLHLSFFYLFSVGHPNVSIANFFLSVIISMHHTSRLSKWGIKPDDCYRHVKAVKPKMEGSQRKIKDRLSKLIWCIINPQKKKKNPAMIKPADKSEKVVPGREYRDNDGL